MANLWLAARNITALAGRRVSHVFGELSGRRTRQRQRRRAAREAEQAAFRTAEQEVLDEIAALARGTRPIVVGPWFSEVGYEVLYWVPFVRWIAAEHRLPPERLVVVSRGGVGAWYADLAERYVDIFDLVPPDEFAQRNRQRIDAAAGGQKQLGDDALGRDIISRAKARLGIGDAAVCHPSLMYRLFRQFWAGNRSLDSVLQRLRFEPPRADGSLTLPSLPSRFAAVKIYTGMALPDSASNRVVLRQSVRQVAEDRRVVLLDSPRALDEHEDFGGDVAESSVTLRTAMTPANNLGVQTEVLRRSERFITTCGGLAWLAPMMGIDTVALYSDDRFLATHLYVARHVYRRMPGAGTFATVDVRGMTLAGALQEQAR